MHVPKDYQGYHQLKPRHFSTYVETKYALYLPAINIHKLSRVKLVANYQKFKKTVSWDLVTLKPK